MATELTFRAQLGRLIPAGEDAEAWVIKRNGQLVSGKYSQPRSLEQNSLLWAVAKKTFNNLPARWDGIWADKYRMVKGLQLAVGITTATAVPTKAGADIVMVPSSIADMDRDEATAACDLLFKGMARLLNIDVDTLLAETEAA